MRPVPARLDVLLTNLCAKQRERFTLGRRMHHGKLRIIKKKQADRSPGKSVCATSG
jgi:hypothetical protein